MDFIWRAVQAYGHGPVVIVVLIGIAVCWLLARGGLSALVASQKPYQGNRFLSENEKAFFKTLKASVGHEYQIFAQVRLADLVQIDPSLDAASHQRALNRVACKSVDFVLCGALSLDPVAAIEVDDRSHLRFDRQQRDQFVNQVFKEIGLPLLRVRAKRTYDPAELRGLLQTIGIGPATGGLQPARPVW
jgi:hypothetical protein